MEPLTEEMLRHNLTDRYGDNVDLIALAALGITRLAWRSDRSGHVEAAHATRLHGGRDRISDGEMFAANVATTRLILSYIHAYPDANWDALAHALVDPSRIAGRRTIVDLLGKTRHRRWAMSAGMFIDGIVNMIEKHGTEFTLLFHAVAGAEYDRWWSGPRWQELVDNFMGQLTDDPPGLRRDDLRAGLLEAPDQLDPYILDWCTDEQLIGYTRLD